jgi:hypothetical protein
MPPDRFLNHPQADDFAAGMLPDPASEIIRKRTNLGHRVAGGAIRDPSMSPRSTVGEPGASAAMANGVDPKMLKPHPRREVRRFV